MININRYNDFIFDMIIEKVKSKELNLVLSTRLMNLLDKIKYHKIALHLIKEHGMPDGNFKITMLDIDDKEDNFDKFIIVQSNKAYDLSNKLLKDINFKEEDYDIPFINKYLLSMSDLNIEAIFNKVRTPMTIGRVINRLFPNMFSNAGDPNESIESFVDAVKGERTKELGYLKLVEGEDIKKYYSEMYYDSNAGGSLGSSCMRYSKCGKFIDFYVKNKDKVKLLVLMSDDEKDKIVGRALVWNVSVVNNDGTETIEERVFMDRIYTIYRSDEQKFKLYAKKQGWLHKEHQDMYGHTYIIDTKTDKSDKKNLIVKNIKTHYSYPYIDTLKYIDFINGVLSNNEDVIDIDAELNSTNGGYTDDNGNVYMYSENQGEIVHEDDYNDGRIWCDYEGEYADEDEAYWSDYLNSYVTQYYMDNYMVYSETMNDHIPDNDSIYIDEINDYVTTDYADKNFYYCEMNDTWYTNSNDIIDSDEQGWIPKDESVLVYLDMEGKKTDYRFQDGSYITYYNGEEFYENKLRDNFVQVIVDIKNNIKKNFKKEEDKDKYFLFKGKYYHRKFKDEMTGQLRIWDDKDLYNEKKGV